MSPQKTLHIHTYKSSKLSFKVVWINFIELREKTKRNSYTDTDIATEEMIQVGMRAMYNCFEHSTIAYV